MPNNDDRFFDYLKEINEKVNKIEVDVAVIKSKLVMYIFLFSTILSAGMAALFNFIVGKFI